MSSSPSDSATVIIINNDGMGKANTELQHKLIGTYLRLLEENGSLPAAICFYTDGVKLTTAGSPVIDQLRSLEAKGVRLILCSTCLDYSVITIKINGLTIWLFLILKFLVTSGKY